MPVGTTPYPTAQDSLNVAILASNDGSGPNGMEGNVLNPETNPQVLPAFFTQWRYLQDRLISGGVDTFAKTQVVANLPQTATSDPKVLMVLTYNGYFDGQVWHGPNITAPSWDIDATYTQGMTVTFNNIYYVALPNSTANTGMEPDISGQFWQPFNQLGPTLPIDLVKPLELWECSSSGGTRWIPMTQAPDSITPSVIQPRFGSWSGTYDRIFLPGASQYNNLLIKYLPRLPDIVTFETPLMVIGSERALAYLVLEQLSGARGGPMAAQYHEQAEWHISQILNQTVRKQAYAQFVRKPFRSRNRGYGSRSGL